MKNYLLAHGFGFTDSYWKNLVPLLTGNIYYYGDSDIDANKEYIGIGHSLGFLKLNNSGLNFSHLICVQGFLNFCGNQTKLRKIREYNLEKIIEDFCNDHESALKNFYKACGYNIEIPITQRKEDLLKDLKMMRKAYKHCGVETIAIATKNDIIVPKIVMDDNFSKISNVTMKYVEGNICHTLGFDKPEVIIDAIHEITN